MQIDEEYFKSEEFQEILESYEASVNDGNSPFMDADDLVDIADYYSWKDLEEKAEEAIDYALELYPNATLPNVFKARKALNRDDYEEAAFYRNEIENHDDPDYHYLVAEIMIAEGNVEEADEYLREYGKTVDPDEYEDFVRDCANLYIDYEESMKAFEWMLRSKGDGSDDFKELMARALFGIGKYKDSERLFNELVDKNPFSENYWTALASAQYMNNDFSSSITSSEYAIAIAPNDPEPINNKAVGLFKMGNFEEALKYFKKYIELVPEDEVGLLHEGVCLSNLNRYEEAVTVLRMSLALTEKDSPLRPQIYQELAFCYSGLHQIKQAMEMLDQTETLDCDHLDMLVVRAHLLLQNGKVDEAQKAYQTAIMKSEHNPQIMLRVIVSLHDNHLIEACYNMLLKFLDMIEECYPDFKNGYAYMALCCFDLKYWDEFMKYLRLAVDKNPREAQEVLYWMFPENTPVSEYVSYMEQHIPQNPS